MKNLYSSRINISTRLLVYLLSFLIVYTPISIAAEPKDASQIGREAQTYTKDVLLLKTPDVSEQSGQLNVGMSDGTNPTTSVLNSPLKYTDLVPAKKPNDQSGVADSADVEALWNSGEDMDAEGSKRKATLFNDANSDDPGLSGQVYKTLMDTQNIAKPDMTNDPLFDTTRYVHENMESLTQEFADCTGTTSFNDVTKRQRVSDFKSCTKIYDKSESCSINHNFRVGIIEPVSGDIQMERVDQDTIMIMMGRDSNNNLRGNCAVHELKAIWRIQNPQAITSAVLKHVRFDDYIQIYLNGEHIYHGPNELFPPETAGECELGTSWRRYPNIDLTSVLKSVNPGDTIEFNTRVSVSGRGEAYSEFEISYDPALTITEESWTPDSCLDHLYSARAGFATVTYDCSLALNAATSTGEYKGDKEDGGEVTQPGDLPTFCEGGTVTHECPEDASNPWEMNYLDKTCKRNEDKQTQPIVKEIKGCLDESFTLNRITGVCEKKQNLLTAPYTTTDTYSCPNDGNTWIYNESLHTCTATITQSKPAKQEPVKGCNDSAYEYHSDTDTCNLPGVDGADWVENKVYSCPLDAAKPWSLNKDRCERRFAISEPPIENSSWACATIGYTYSAFTHSCRFTEYERQPYAETPIYECPVDEVDPWILSSNSCTRIKRLEKPAYTSTITGTTTFSCDSGWNLLDEYNPPVCEKMDRQNISATRLQEDLCPESWEDTGTDCRQGTTLTEPPIVRTTFSCKSGFNLDETVSPAVCNGTKYENMAATQITEFECGEGQVSDESVGACVPDSVLSSDYTSLSEYKCPVDLENPWTLFDGKCTRNISSTIPANRIENWVCPNTYSWNNSTLQCEKNQSETQPYDSDNTSVCPDDPLNPWTLNAGICTRNTTDTLPAEFVEVKGCSTGWTYDAALDDCFKNRLEVMPKSAPITYECPVDNINPWTLTGDACTRTVRVTQSSIATPQYSCPTDYVFNSVDKTCSKTITTELSYLTENVQSCNPGWTLDGEICTRSFTDSAPAISTPVYGCSDGWTYNAVLNTCTQSATYQPYTVTTNYSCDSGWTLSGTNCSKSVTDTQPATPVYSCDVGWTLSGSNCTQSTILTQASIITYTCPVGWTVSGSNCTKPTVEVVASNVTYSCPTGWEINPTNGSQCRKLMTQLADPFKREFLCEQWNWMTSTGTNVGADTINQRCLYLNTSTGQFYTVGHYGLQSSQSNCPTGKNCYSTNYIWHTQPCATGFVYQGTATSTTLFTTNSCKRTYYDYQPATPNYSCLTGYSLSADKLTCSRTILSSTPATPNYSCPSSWSLSIDLLSCRKFSTTSVPANISSYTCPSTWTLGGMTCSKTSILSVPATSTLSNSCPDGWVNNGTQCQLGVDSSIPATPLSFTYSCPSDRVLNTVPSTPICDKVVTETVPANITVINSCPDGFSDTGSLCRKVVIDTFPATFTGNVYTCGSTYTLDSVTPVPGCYRDDVQNQPAIAITHEVCEDGWTETPTSCNKIFVDRIPYIVTNTYWACTSGFELNTSGPEPVCQRLTGTEEVPANIDINNHCPEGWTDSGFDCRRTTTVTAPKIQDGFIYACPGSFTLDQSGVEPVCHGLVEQQQDPVLETLNTCPEGWINTGTKCISSPMPITPSDIISHTNVCMELYLLDESVSPATCTLTKDSVRDATKRTTNSCPPDYQDTGLGCEKFDLVTAESIVVGEDPTCTTGWTLDQSTSTPICKKTEVIIQAASKICTQPDASSPLSIENIIEDSAAPVLRALKTKQSSTTNTKSTSTVARYISLPTETPNLGGDGEDNCFLHSESGIEICESHFGTSPIPPDMAVSPFCQKLDITVNYDYYKGEFCYTDVYGDEVCAQSGVSSDDTCDELESDSQCSFIKQQCVQGAIGTDGRCYLNELIYDCGSYVSYNDVEADTTFDCAGPVRCMGSDCIDPDKEQSTSFAKAAALMNAAQFMGQDLDCVQNTVTGELDCQVFSGKDYYCKVAVGGAQDCCDVPSNVGPGDYLQAVMSIAKAHKTLMAVQSPGTVVGGYQAMAETVSSAFSTVTKPFASYIENISGAVDSITQPINQFVEEIKQQVKDYIKETMQKLFQKTGENMAENAAIGEASDQAAQEAADQASSSIMDTIGGAYSAVMTAYTVYVVAMMIIQAVYKCEDFEFELAPKRDTHSCTYLGSYCADDLCLEKRKSYCCYNTPLSRIINEQASIQLGRTYNKKDPNCAGLSVAEMGQLDWSQIDLSEWSAMLTKYNLNPEVNAKDFTLDSLTGSGSLYSDMFPDSDRQDAGERLLDRSEELDLDEVKQNAREDAPVDMDGCDNCDLE